MSADSCRLCHHTSDVHRHLRRGTDCSMCECPKLATAIDVVMARLVRKPAFALVEPARVARTAHAKQPSLV